MSKTSIPKALRNRIAEQARFRCGYCLTQEAIVGTAMEIDHIFPEALGGLTDEANLWLACSLCNTFKGDRIMAADSESGEMVRLFDPRRQLWHDHVAWSHGYDLIIGVTPVGRAPTIALQLNRPSLVRARKLWRSVGWHPPTDEAAMSLQWAFTSAIPLQPATGTNPSGIAQV